MASIRYSEVRKGMVIVHEGQLCYVVDRDLKTPGNLPSKLTLTMKNLKTGFVNTQRVHPEDKVEQAYLDKREMQYLYQDGDGYVFMDTETYDQITLDKEWVGDLMLYLKEGNKAQIVFYEGKPLSLDLPATVELQVTETEPSVKGQTASSSYKSAVLENGEKIMVPVHIGPGTRVVVSTEDGSYKERAKD